MVQTTLKGSEGGLSGLENLTFMSEMLRESQQLRRRDSHSEMDLLSSAIPLIWKNKNLSYIMYVF